MVILRNKSFSRLKNAVNDYKCALETYMNDRKDPRALKKFEKQLKSEQKHIMEDNFHDFDDKNKIITFKEVKNSDGSMKKISFKSKEKYENEKSRLKKLREDIKKDWSDDKINKSIAEYDEGLRHPRRRALKNAIQNLYSDIEKEEDKKDKDNNLDNDNKDNLKNKLHRLRKIMLARRLEKDKNKAAILHAQNDYLFNQASQQAHINSINLHSIARMGHPIM